MAAPRGIVWKLDPHTRAKHEILKRYLQAWMIILSQGSFPDILYIDGFAGPGEYEGGEPGSPIIALDAALNHRSHLSARIHFLFVEEKESRANHLRQLISARKLPDNFDVVVEGGTTFLAAFDRNVRRYQRSSRLFPTFAFIDPFGWTGAPFGLIKHILTQPSCEVFVNFMYEEINRFLSHRDQVQNFDDFFGTNAWKECVDETDPTKRNRCLHDLYLSQLRDAANAKYVRSFEMSNMRDVTDYYLFYATNKLLGLKKMKEAMWKADESGGFRFSDATNPDQLILFEKSPNYDALRANLLVEFAGRQVRVEEIETFIVAQTAFRETHYKGILKSLEMESGQLAAINPVPGRKKGTFGDPEMLVRFA